MLKKPKHLICERCNYEWHYKGMMFFTKCPRCNRIVDTRRQEVMDDGTSPAG